MLLGAFSMTMNGETLTPEQALARVLKTSSASKMKKTVRTDETKLAFTATESEADATPMVYVFSKGTDNGYIVAAADDRFPALLGFSDSGSFSDSEMPPAMKWWLSEYAKEMSAAIANDKNGALRMADLEEETERDMIEPLVKAKWNQSAPYNGLSPKLGSSETVTGCVATALAQVMHYHKWPAVGEGSNSYVWQPTTTSAAKTLSLDFSTQNFDWDNMLDEYVSGKYTTEQSNAVAQLMYACGIAVDMTYNTSASGGSSAQSYKQHLALANYFKYSSDIRYKERAYSTSQEFEDIIYDNLKRDLPVLYHGRSSGGGHSFVCDGYAGDHYFHFNWGWGGSSDGYFLLHRLNPKDLGIGAGSGGGYNESQGITYNIYPIKDGETPNPAPMFFACTKDFGFSEEKVSLSAGGDQLVYSVFSGGFYNRSDALFSGCLGVILENVKTGEMTPYVGRTSNNVKFNYGYSSLSVYLENAPEGTYRVYPGVTYSTSDRKLQKMVVANNCNDHLILHVTEDGRRFFSDPTVKVGVEDAPELVANLFTVQGDDVAKSNTSSNVMMSFTNASKLKDYYGDITIQLSDADGNLWYEEPFTFNIPGGCVQPYTYAFAFPVEPGEYIVTFKDDYGRVMPGEFPLTVDEAAEPATTDIQVVSFSPVEFAPPKTATDQVKFTIRLTNTTKSTISAPKISLYFYNEEGTFVKGNTPSWSSSTLAGGATKNFTTTQYLYYTGTGTPKGEPLPAGKYTLSLYIQYTNASKETVKYYMAKGIKINITNSITKVKLEQGPVNIPVGGHQALYAEVEPQEASVDGLVWTSSNPSVAKVVEGGYVMGMAPGKSYIVATSPNGLYDVCEVNVADTSAVENVISEGAEIIAVYTPSGAKVADRPSADEMNALAKGIYVVVTDKGSYKLVK